jgi:hypothetical protein
MPEEPRHPTAHRHLLTENQRRHLQIRFTGLLAEAEELSMWAGGAAVAYNLWTGELVAELERLTGSLRAAAARLRLDVDRPVVSPERHVASWASSWWAEILECRPRSLRGYGVVEPELERELGPVVDEIAASLVRVRSLVRAGSAERREVTD